MNEPRAVVLGADGQLVLPAEVMARAGIAEGTQLMLLESDGGLILLTREQLLDRTRNDLAGLDLVAELLADRSREAEIGDVG